MTYTSIQEVPDEEQPAPGASAGADPPPEGVQDGTAPELAEAGSEDGADGFLGWFNSKLVTVGETQITPLNLLVALLIVLLAFQFSRILQRLISRGLRKAGIEEEGAVGTVGRLVHYAVIVIGVLVAISHLGIQLQTLLTAGAVFAVGFGFAMQNIAQNFVSGVILLVERTIKPGDVLEVEGRIVRVVDMGIRSTVARTRDEEEIIVPNSTLVQNTVKNFTLRDSVYRLRAVVGVTYSSDMELVLKALEETAREIDWREKDRAPRVHLIQFADSSVVWEVSVWIQNPWMAPRLLSRLNQAVWWALKSNGITIAFPQMDVHIDPRVEDVLRRMTRHDEEPQPIETA